MRDPIELGEIIARRELSLSGGDPVLIEIGIPFEVKLEHSEYRCPYRITGIGSGRVRASIGIDALQALMLALQVIGSDLYSSEEYRTGRLSWFADDWSRSLGLPVFEGFRDLLPAEPIQQDGVWPPPGDRQSDQGDEEDEGGR
ncbi:MAG TPA: hypothetical protein VIT45_03040 [Allosphingosinicella sp.]